MIRLSPAAAWVAMGLACVVLVGCGPKPRLCPDTVYTVEDLVAQNNANAAKVPQLRARAELIRVKYTNEQNQSKEYSLEGTLDLRKAPDDPFGTQDFMLRGKVGLGAEVFRLGTDAKNQLFYLRIQVPGETGDTRGCWGRTADLPGLQAASTGKQGGISGFDPAQLLTVLGVMPWPADFDTVLSNELSDICAYEVQFLGPRPGGGVRLTRKVWLDRYEPSHRPTRVQLYDSLGRVTMDARLGKYRAIQTADPEEQWPVMPTDIQANWPLAKFSMRLVFTDPDGLLTGGGETRSLTTLENATMPPTGFDVKAVAPEMLDLPQMGLQAMQ